VLGKEHPSTLMSMNSLAMVLKDQGKYEQAEEMLRQALRLRETVLGKEHPSTLMSMNNLAGVLMDQGKYERAEEMLQQSWSYRIQPLSSPPLAQRDLPCPRGFQGFRDPS
jgi:tetratricopeptide (TPR) repeat protein